MFYISKENQIIICTNRYEDIYISEDDTNLKQSDIKEIKNVTCDFYSKNPQYFTITNNSLVFNENKYISDKRNKEIDQKIAELNEMCIPEIVNGNTENIELYKQVIEGLELARP